jgi:hypothetical protein
LDKKFFSSKLMLAEDTMSGTQESLPTFATDSTGAELYTLNISEVTRVVTVSTRIVNKIMYDRKPVVIYGV